MDPDKMDICIDNDYASNSNQIEDDYHDKGSDLSRCSRNDSLKETVVTWDASIQLKSCRVVLEPLSESQIVLTSKITEKHNVSFPKGIHMDRGLNNKQVELETTFECEICDKRFAMESQLLLHHLEHLAPGPIKSNHLFS